MMNKDQDNNFIQPIIRPIVTLKEQIKQIAEKCAKQFLCNLVDIKMIKRIGKIQILVEKQDQTPMSLDICAGISRDFCTLLDVHFPDIRNKFAIDVMSAGIERILKIDELINTVGKRIAVSYNIDEKSHYNVFFVLEANDNQITVIEDNQIKKLLEIKNIAFILNKYMQGIGKNFKNSNYNEKVQAILEIRQNVAKINNFNDIHIFQEKLNTISLTYDRINQARLKPYFD